MRSVFLGVLAAFVAASQAHAEVCLQNDTDGTVEIVPTIVREDGSPQTKRIPIASNDGACITISGRWVSLQVYVATTWQGLPANYKYDCPLPQGNADLRYRFVGTSRDTYRCEME